MCAKLNCHWQTLLYRQKKGDLTPIRIGRRKYYAAGEVEQLLKHRPIAHKRPNGAGGSGEITGYQYGAVVEKPTLWQRIKALFV